MFGQVDITLPYSESKYQAIPDSGKYFALINVKEWSLIGGEVLCIVTGKPVLVMLTVAELVLATLKFGEDLVGYIDCLACTVIFEEYVETPELIPELLLLHLEVYIWSELDISFRECYNRRVHNVNEIDLLRLQRAGF